MADLATPGIVMSPNWEKFATRYGAVASDRVRWAGLIQAALDEGQKTVVEELDRLIYLAPPPPSARGHEAAYLASHRTGRTRAAVQKKPKPVTGNTYEGAVVVDRSFYDETYYARPLEQRPPQRGGRPFFRNSAIQMRVKFRQLGVDHLLGIKIALTTT